RLGAGEPAGLRHQSDDEIRARAAEANGVERAVVELARSHTKPRDVIAPRRHGVGRVQTSRRLNGGPETVEIGLAERGLRPAGGRAGYDRPGVEAVVLGL